MDEEQSVRANPEKVSAPQRRVHKGGLALFENSRCLRRVDSVQIVTRRVSFEVAVLLVELVFFVTRRVSEG